jgi:hypothetical protein
MAVVNIPGIVNYHLPKMRLKKVEITNKSNNAKNLVVDYEFVHKLKPNNPITSTLINKYIRPVVVVMPTIELALAYENFIKTSDVIDIGPEYLLPFYQHNPDDQQAVDHANLNSPSFLNQQTGTTNTLFLGRALVSSRYAISDNVVSSGSPNFASHATAFGAATGILPEDFDALPPAMQQAFEARIQTRFRSKKYAQTPNTRTYSFNYDDVRRQIDFDVILNNQSLDSQINKNVDLYMYYFSILDIQGLTTDSDFINITDTEAFDEFHRNNERKPGNRVLYHGEIGKEVILSGVYNQNQKDHGLKAVTTIRIFRDNQGNFITNKRIFKSQNSNSYYTTNELDASDASCRANLKQYEETGITSGHNPFQFERINAIRIPNMKIVDKRNLQRFTGYSPPETGPVNTLDVYGSPGTHESELNYIANKISNTISSIQHSNTNLEKLLSLNFPRDAIRNEEIIEENLELQKRILINKIENNNKGNFKCNVITTPDFGRGIVEFHVIFNQEKILKGNSLVGNFLEVKNSITRFTEEELNREKLSVLAPREKLYTVNVKVLRKKVSDTYNKPNKFGALSGKSQLEDESLYNKYGSDVVCESFEDPPRPIIDSVEHMKTATITDLYAESETLHPIVNTEGVLKDISYNFIDYVEGNINMDKPPVKRIFKIEDRGILNKSSGTYQYGMEITYADPMDRIIEESLLKANAVVFFLQKVLDHLNSPNAQRAKSFLNKRLQKLADEATLPTVKSEIYEFSDLMAAVHSQLFSSAGGIEYSVLSTTEEEFSQPIIELHRLLPLASTSGDTIISVLKNAFTNSFVDCYSLVCTILGNKTEIALQDVINMTSSFGGLGDSYANLEQVIQIMKNLISSLSSVSGFPLARTSIESKYSLDTHVKFKPRQRKTFKVSTWFENANGKDHYVNVSDLKSSSMVSLNDIISQGTEESMSQEEISDRVMTQGSIREMYQKEVDKFNANPRSQPLSFEDNLDAVFTVTPNFYRLRDYMSQRELSIPLFEEVAGADYFAASYQGAASHTAENLLRRESDNFASLNPSTSAALAVRARRMRRIANTFGMMLGVFHVLTHEAKAAQEGGGSFIPNQFADGYNFLFDVFDPSVLMSTLNTKAYYSNQRATPVSSLPNSGFIADAPTVLDGGQTSIYQSERKYTVNNLELSGEMGFDPESFSRGAIPDFFSTTTSGQQRRNFVVTDFIRYSENLQNNFFNYYQANNYSLRCRNYLSNTVFSETPDTMIGLINQHMLNQSTGLENLDDQLNYPGVFYYNAPGQIQRYLNPLIYGEVKCLVRYDTAVGSLNMENYLQQRASYSRGGLVTIREVQDGLQPGVYCFISLSDSPFGAYSSAPTYSAPFRVIGDSDARVPATIINRGLYTPGGEFRYPISHPSRSGREYIGHYHVNPETGEYMVGMHHSDQAHDRIERIHNLSFQGLSVTDRRKTLRPGAEEIAPGVARGRLGQAATSGASARPDNAAQVPSNVGAGGGTTALGPGSGGGGGGSGGY